ncbi:MAG: hypothetical protein MJ053_01770 [Elusimicrobiaceae bacterium]|nr:hypothetical protein [Elusimicrobiaceae bacterium]
MKKTILSVICTLATLSVCAETLKMKDGTLISGSILSQTEYTLNLATSYGNITLSQREIEQILPDKHRLILKGGSQLVGIILDMDEFNLKLQTDDGTTVNVDMPQIVTIEAYDYDRGQNAQQEFVEKKLEQQEQASQKATEAAAVAAAGGLTFDTDIDQVFEAKKATVVNGQVQTPAAHIQAATPRPLTDEESFVQGVKTGAVTQQEYAAAAKKELTAKKPAAKAATATGPRAEKSFSKYFSVQLGAMPLDLKTGNTLKVGSDTLDLNQPIDMGGTSVVASSKFLWRIRESNLWLGPALSFASVASNSFSFTSGGTTVEAKSSGSLLQFGVAGHYYLNPKDKFAYYITAAALYEMLSVNYHGTKTPPNIDFSESLSNNGLAASVGLGVETWVDDVMLGLEVRQVFSPRKNELKDSASSNTVIQAQLSWKF